MEFSLLFISYVVYHVPKLSLFTNLLFNVYCCYGRLPWLLDANVWWWPLVVGSCRCWLTVLRHGYFHGIQDHHFMLLLLFLVCSFSQETYFFPSLYCPIFGLIKPHIKAVLCEYFYDIMILFRQNFFHLHVRILNKKKFSKLWITFHSFYNKVIKEHTGYCSNMLFLQSFEGFNLTC